MSLSYQTFEGGSRIVAQIEPPSRKPPRQIIVRFRHPGKALLTGARVNGREAKSFDADREWMVLPATAENITVEALY